MTDRLREALEALADRTPPADPHEFAEQVLDAVPSRRPRWVVPAVAAAAAVIVAAVALPLVGDDGDEDRVVTTSTTSTTGATTSTSVPGPPTPVVNRWQRVDLFDPDPSSAVELTDVAVSGSRVVVVGTASATDMWDAVVYSSEDGGATWRQAPSLVGPPADESMLGVVALDDGFVAVGRSGPAVLDWHAVAWHSPDGLRWSQVSMGGPRSESAEAVARRGDRLVAVGAGGTGQAAGAAAWYSDDRGRTWQRAAIQGPGYANAVTATPNGFVAVGSAAAWTSPDGTQWTRVAVQPEWHMLDVALGPEGLVAVGAQGNVWASSDGSRWRKGLGAGSELRDVLPLSDGTWLLSGTHVWTSDDGRAWVKSTDPAFDADLLIRGLAEVGDGRVVAVGSVFTTTGGDDSDSEPAVWVRR